jgi:chromatin remodeling complex protein RSC6
MLSTSDKFELLITDFAALMDSTKSITARMKVLHKEFNKSSRSTARSRKKSRVAAADADPDAPKRSSALQKPVAISNELCKFLSFDLDSEHSRQDVTAAVNMYIKTHNLQDPTNRRFILLDGCEEAARLKTLLRDPDQPVTFFNIQRYLKPHYPMSVKDKKALENPKETPAVVAPVVIPDKGVVADMDTVEDAPKDSGKLPAKKRVVRNPKTA